MSRKVSQKTDTSPNDTKFQQTKTASPPVEIVIGEDGFPIPIKLNEPKPQPKKFQCICPICHNRDAKLQVTKKSTYLLQCLECKIVLYMNHAISMSLFRGLQKFFEKNPELMETISHAIVENAPSDNMKAETK